MPPRAPILLRDVVGKSPPITAVGSAEEGLLVSLDRTGGIDMELIARLYGKPEQTVIAELNDLIYRDPQTQAWQTADAYLSGNVRDKLKAAEQAGADYARNAVALRSVQPEDVLPGDIDANLGAPWLPAADIQAFAGALFGVAPAAIPIGHLKKDAVWSVEAGHAAEASVAATAEYGTQKANGTWLFELALNMKTPVIHDKFQGPNGEERVVNQEETLAAREKQKRIKEAFKSWVFREPERTERLVRLYNDTYNNLRPRLFDGGHLDFPGMSQGIALRQHQKDAVWRGMSSGNTLLAHAVGAGKTFTMAATGMKLKQAGLVKKPMFVVPNHMLEQFSREFMQLYPNAKLLVAGKEDLTRDRRKLLTAKIAGGEWDGIIVTHSSFERIGMSCEYQKRFLREQIQEYDQLLRDHGGNGTPRNIIKTIEKQKARREERLKELAAEDKKDDGLVFDELGVDHVFHRRGPLFQEPGNADQDGASGRHPDRRQRAGLRRLHEGPLPGRAASRPRRDVRHRHADFQHDGRAVYDAALPRPGRDEKPGHRAFRRLGRHLRRSGRHHGNLAGRRHSPAQPLCQIHQPARTPADVPGFRRRADGRHARFAASRTRRRQAHRSSPARCRTSKLPSSRGWWPATSACGREKVDPREDNALAITTDGRKLALDARLLSATAEDFPGSKINGLVENVAAIWRKTAASAARR